MQIARSKQEKIEKMVKNSFPSIADYDTKSNPQSPKARRGMDIENVKDQKPAGSGTKKICAGCDLEIMKSKEDDYFSECSDCGSSFCR